MAPKPDTLSPNDGGLQPPRSPKSNLQALPPGRTRNSPSHGQGQIRKPAVEWNNAAEIDDGQDEALEISDDEGEDAKPAGAEAVEKRSPSGGQVIDLLDIARPVKPKGKRGVVHHP